MNPLVKSLDEKTFLNFKDKNLIAESFSMMDELRQQRHLCDVILKVANKTLYAHRVVLAASIPCFCAMFTKTMTESQLKEITMKEIEPSALESLVDFAYRGEVRIDKENVRSLMSAASYLQLTRVRDACAEFLVTHLNLADVLVTRSFAKSMDCSHLVTAADEYICQHFGGRHGSCGNNVGKIYVVGGRNNVRVRSVEIYDPVTNKWQMGEEMSAARSGFGVAVSLGKLYVFGGHNDKGSLSTVEVFDPKTKKWSQGQEMITKRRYAAVAVVNNLIYVCGGRDGDGSHLNTVERFCPSTVTWRTVAPMMERRWGGAAAELGGYVYVAGDCGLDSVEKYDPVQNSWVQVKPLIEKRAWFGLTTLNGKLYACGGHNGDDYLQSAEVYDPADDVWKLISPMNRGCYGLALVENMGKLWAIGGFDGKSYLSSVEVYDPVTDKWSFVAPMSVPRCDVAAAVIEN